MNTCPYFDVLRRFVMLFSFTLFMGNGKKLSAVTFASLLMVLMLICQAKAEVPKPSLPEFTAEWVDHSYDVPPKVTSTTNPYTGKNTTTTIPGYHVESKTVEVTINNSVGASYYNFRYKGSYTPKWNYEPFDPYTNQHYTLGDTFDVPYQVSNSSCTVATLPSILFKDVPEGGQIDVQVQALFGYFRAVPYGHAFWVGGPTYDFYFNGTTSDWSNTQTITIPNASPTSSTVPTIQPTTEPTPSHTVTFSTSATVEPTLEPTARPKQQTGFLGTNLPIEYSYEIVAAFAIIVVAGLGLVYFKRVRK